MTCSLLMSSAATSIRGQTAPGPRIEGHCSSSNPYLAVAVHPNDLDAERRGRSIVATRDSDDNDFTAIVPIARLEDTGSIWGLAYDPERNDLYASAGPKSDLPIGAAGAGAIYRIDLDSGAVVPWRTLDVGVDFDPRDAERLVAIAGRRGIGDIDIDVRTSSLFAVNLSTRWIEHLSVPDGRSLGRIAIGGARETWSADARPFGLATWGGSLYHGVVDAKEGSAADDAPTAFVYRSRLDGSRMEEILRFDLTYRTERRWAAWNDLGWDRSSIDAPQPIIADLVVRDDGTPIIGIANRLAAVHHGRAASGGDALPTDRDAFGELRLSTPTDLYRDDTSVVEALYGSLAIAAPGPGASIVAAGVDVLHDGPAADGPSTAGLLWFRARDGRVAGPVDGREPLTSHEPPGLGDVELLCSPEDPPPTATPPSDLTPLPTPSRTPVVSTPSPPSTATASPPPSATSTIETTTPATPTVTPSATPGTRDIYLPITLRDDCPAVEVDAVLVLDLSSSMLEPVEDGPTRVAAAVEAARTLVGALDVRVGGPNRLAIVGFNDRAWVEEPLTDEPDRLSEALERVDAGVSEGTRLDLGLDVGGSAFGGAGRDTLRRRILVLLTDGRPNRVPAAEDGSVDTTILRVASRLHALGVRVHVVGFAMAGGSGEALLHGIAGEGGSVHFAASGIDLAAEFNAIGSRARCPRAPTSR